MITMEGKVVKDSALVRADYDFTVKSGQEVWFDLRKKSAWQIWQATFAWQFAE